MCFVISAADADADIVVVSDSSDSLPDIPQLVCHILLKEYILI